MFLAALIADAVGDRPDGVAVARRLVGRLELGAAAEQQVALLVEDRDLLLAAIRQPDGLGEASVLAVASHLDTPERARALFILSGVRTDGLERWEYDQLRELHELVQEALALPDLTGLDARNLVGRRRAQASRVAGDDPAMVRRIEEAPRAYVLAVEGEDLARHAKLLSRLGRTDRVVVGAGAVDAAQWLDVAAFDRPGLLAAVSAVLAAQDLDIEHAIVATWEDGRALESFRLRDGADVDTAQLRDAIDGELDAPLAAPPIPDAVVTFD